jgi:glucokinase
MAMASEAAHGEFAARTEAEWQLKQWLLQDQGLQRVSIERVVSGPGLGQVFRWCLSQHTGSTPHRLHQPSQLWASSDATAPERPDLPALVASAAQAGDPLAQQALSIWLGAYGSVAGDLVLQSLCLGGLWIGGGTAGKLLDQLGSNAFLGPFGRKGRLSAVVGQVPVKALTDAGAGLFSAACRARMLLAV